MTEQTPELWIWWPYGGMPQEPGYASGSAAREAVMAYLAEHGQIGTTDGEGDWRPLATVPDGFAEGFELYVKGVRYGQQVLRRA
jgi:hypothetical protein